MLYKYLLVQIYSSDLFFWADFIFLKKLYGPFYGWDSTASRLQKHYEEALYFLPRS